MSLDLLSGLLAPYQGGGAPMETTSPLLSLALQSVMQQAQQPTAPSSSPSFAGGGGGGGGMAPIQGSGAATQLASRAARAVGVPAAWAHDPKFWYETEHESGLYPTGNWQDILKASHADNPTSTAYGIGQLLASNQQAYGPYGSPLQQMEAMFKYINDRYGSPESAYNHRMQVGWY